MRRILFLLVLVAPASVLGQSQGGMSFSPVISAINIAQCRGERNEVRGADDALTVDLTWQLTFKDGKEFSTGGKYRLWASNRTPNTTTGVACEEPSGATGFKRSQVGQDFNNASDDTFTAQDVRLMEIATDAGFGACSEDDDGSQITLCVQWLDASDSNAVNGWATATISLDLSSPTPPAGVAISAGDGVLRVSCNESSDKDAYKARVISTDPGDTRPRWSSELESCDDLRISGLTNNQDYTVVVFGLDEARNPSEPSEEETGTPIPTDDFWEEYQQQDGAEQGGCNTGAGAAGIVGALALIAAAAAARRRKP